MTTSYRRFCFGILPAGESGPARYEGWSRFVRGLRAKAGSSTCVHAPQPIEDGRDVSACFWFHRDDNEPVQVDEPLDKVEGIIVGNDLPLTSSPP